MTIAGVRTKQIKWDWWEACGYDTSAPDAHYASYWTCGETEAIALDKLRTCLERQAAEWAIAERWREHMWDHRLDSNTWNGTRPIAAKERK